MKSNFLSKICISGSGRLNLSEEGKKMSKKSGSAYSLIGIGLFLFILVMPNPAYCLWNECQITCQPGYLVSHAFLEVPPANIYKLRQSCSASCGPNAYGATVTIEGTWSGKTAREEITVNCNTIINVSYVTASCPDDPWLNNVSCSGASTKGDPRTFEFLKYPTNYPVSAGFISPGQKQQLKNEKEQKKAPTGPLVEVVSPHNYQEYAGDVLIHVKFRSDIKDKLNKVALKWIWYKPSKPGQFAGETVIMNVLSEIHVQNGEAKATIPRSKFEQYPGQWQVSFDADLQQTPNVLFKVTPTVPAINLDKKIPQQKK
jgi:hypothetical protein